MGECQVEIAAKETVIIVHGTYAAPKAGVSRWYQPVEGEPATKGFITELNDALRKRGSTARCWAHCRQGDQGFHWSGENNWVARTRAATELAKYVLNLWDEGWVCHIVAHSHGGNVVLEALHKMATARPYSSVPLGKIVTLGTPFMDTISPILQRIRANQRFLIGLSWIALAWLILSPAIVWVVFEAFALRGATAVFGLIIPFFVATSGFAFLVFSRKNQTEPFFNALLQKKVRKILAIGSPMDEPWQLLHYLRDAPNPMAVKTDLMRYLASSMQSQILESHQVTRIYGAKSYRDLSFIAKLGLWWVYVIGCEIAVLSVAVQIRSSGVSASPYVVLLPLVFLGVASFLLLIVKFRPTKFFLLGCFVAC
jgi:hypothetical protein